MEKTFKKDRELLAAMRRLGVHWKPGDVRPTFGAGMTRTEANKAIQLYNQISQEFVKHHGGLK